MQCVSIRVSGLGLGVLWIALGQACASADDTEQDVDSLTGSGGSTAAPMGTAGTAATGVAGNGSMPPASGGAPSSGGTAGTEGNPPVTPPAAGGTGNANSGMMGAAGTSMAAGAAGTGAPPPPADALCAPQDPSPSDGVACTLTCTDPCGIKNLGARLCTCTAAVFDCATCEFSVEHPLLEPPTEALPNCALSDDLQEDDETGCMDNQRCQSIGRTPGATDGANRFCGCLAGTWDCDSKPASFGG